MASIKEVAKAAGVSITTVSYVLNDDPRIPESTANRVKEVANEIGYLPSQAARNLKKQSTKTILVAISDFGGPVYHELLDGIHHQLMKEGYTMIVSTGLSSSNLLKERSADAAIVSDIHLSNEFLTKTAKNFGPIILLDRRLSSDRIHSIILDNESAMYELTKAALSKRQRNLIGFVHGVYNTYDNQMRYAGFLKAIHEFQINDHEQFFGSFTKDSGGQVFYEAIQAKRRIPDLFVCANDEMAIGLMDQAKRMGYQVPEQIGICGFDDIELASYVEPKLSTVKIAHREWGMKAAQTALQLIQKVVVSQSNQEAKVIIRDSF